MTTYAHDNKTMIGVFNTATTATWYQVADISCLSVQDRESLVLSMTTLSENLWKSLIMLDDEENIDEARVAKTTRNRVAKIIAHGDSAPWARTGDPLSRALNECAKYVRHFVKDHPALKTLVVAEVAAEIAAVNAAAAGVFHGRSWHGAWMETASVSAGVMQETFEAFAVAEQFGLRDDVHAMSVCVAVASLAEVIVESLLDDDHRTVEELIEKAQEGYYSAASILLKIGCIMQDCGYTAKKVVTAIVAATHDRICGDEFLDEVDLTCLGHDLVPVELLDWLLTSLDACVDMWREKCEAEGVLEDMDPGLDDSLVEEQIRETRVLFAQHVLTVAGKTVVSMS